MTKENEKRAFSIAAFCQRYGIGRTTAYEEIAAGGRRISSTPPECSPRAVLSSGAVVCHD
jgi:hypothetical protein